MNALTNASQSNLRAAQSVTNTVAKPAPEASSQVPQDSVSSATLPNPEPKPNSVHSAPKESKLNSFFKSAAVVGTGLAAGAAAAAAGMMGGAAGAVAGMVGGAVLGVTAVAGLGAAAFVALAKESPVGAFVLLAAGTVVATALSPIWIGGAIAGTVAVGALGAAGGPAAAAMAGLGCGILGAAAAKSAQQAFQ